MIVALLRCVFECGGGSEYSGVWLLVGLGASAGWFGIAGACDYAAVALGSAGGGVWLQVSCSMGLHPFASFGGSLARGRMIPGSLCLSSPGGLLQHNICGLCRCLT